MATFISHNPEETETLGQRLAERLDAGAVVGLSGDLGAGKTRLVQGIARALGIRGRVQSPTFALVNVHAEGRIPLYHLDLYRLDTPAQIQSAGLEEYLGSDGVTVIEWAERWFGSEAGVDQPPLPVGYKTVHLEVLSETMRRITYEGFGD
jgi:tRNA threonylcarbamoyladenosine biosynthesis protein TsaE